MINITGTRMAGRKTLIDWINRTYFHYKPKKEGREIYWIESHGNHEKLSMIAHELDRNGIPYSMFPDARWSLRVKDQKSIERLLSMKGVKREKEREIWRRMHSI